MIEKGAKFEDVVENGKTVLEIDRFDVLEGYYARSVNTEFPNYLLEKEVILVDSVISMLLTKLLLKKMF